MPIVVPDASEQALLRVLLAIDPAPTAVVYHLYTNDYVPNENSTLASFTELGASAYDPLTVASNEWSVNTASGVTSAVRIMFPWQIDAAATLYGYFVTNDMGDTLMWCERFSGPISIPAGGGLLNFTARLALD